MAKGNIEITLRTSPVEKICKNCHHANPIGPWYSCHESSPEADLERGSNHFAIWPKVGPGDACGDFKSKIQGAKMTDMVVDELGSPTSQDTELEELRADLKTLRNEHTIALNSMKPLIEFLDKSEYKEPTFQVGELAVRIIKDIEEQAERAESNLNNQNDELDVLKEFLLRQGYGRLGELATEVAAKAIKTLKSNQLELAEMLVEHGHAENTKTPCVSAFRTIEQLEAEKAELKTMLRENKTLRNDLDRHNKSLMSRISATRGYASGVDSGAVSMNSLKSGVLGRLSSQPSGGDS